MNDAGNGVSVWDAPGAKVLDNDFRFGRDGIFSIASRKNVFSGNRFRDLRFAIHYMYTNEGEVTDNVSIRQHRRLCRHVFAPADDPRQRLGRRPRPRLPVQFRQRLADHRQHGLGARPTSRALGDVGHARQRGARTRDARRAASRKPTLAAGGRIGPEKCVFIYNTNQNRFRDNWFEGCEIGIHFTAGSEGNEITGNAFIKNQNQVKYVGTRYLDWSKDGRGNYWSDNPAFDLNGDGVGDSAYRPNDLMDKVLWMAPQAKVLVNIPAVQVIRWAQAQFPALLPGGVVDSHPLMAPPARPKLTEGSRP